MGVDIEARSVFSYDRDGSGPAAPLLLIGGAFNVAGNVQARMLAAYVREYAQSGQITLEPSTEMQSVLTVLGRNDLSR